MRLIRSIVVVLFLFSPGVALAQAQAWGDGTRMTLLTTEIATAQFLVEMCKLDAKQVVDDGNTVFELIKELHPISYKRGLERAKAEIDKAQRQREAACSRALERLPGTQSYFAMLAEQVRPLLNK